MEIWVFMMLPLCPCTIFDRFVILSPVGIFEWLGKFLLVFFLFEFANNLGQ